jgi:hypothetical protein
LELGTQKDRKTTTKAKAGAPLAAKDDNKKTTAKNNDRSKSLRDDNQKSKVIAMETTTALRFDQLGSRYRMVWSSRKYSAEHSDDPQIIASNPAHCCLVMSPNDPHEGQARTAQ